MSEQHKALITRFYTAFNEKNVDVMQELFTADIVDHHPTPDQAPGRKGLIQAFVDFFVAFPDVHIENLAIVCEGDLAMVRSRCTGTHTGMLYNLEPTGLPVDFDAIDNWRIANGKLAEVWHVEEVTKMLLQLQTDITSLFSGEQLSEPASLPESV